MMKLFKRLSWEKTAQKSQQGFTLLEVLVAIVVITAFVNVALMGLVTATLFKSKAKAYSSGMSWIQADLEAVRNKAAESLSYSLSANAAAAQKVIVLTSAAGLGANDQIKIGTDSTTYTIQSVSGNSVTLTANLSTAQSASTVVTLVTSAECTATSSTTGFAYYLQQNLPTLTNTTSTTSTTNPTSTTNTTSTQYINGINGRPYTFSRTTAVGQTQSSDPYQVLKLSYTVTYTVPGTSPPVIIKIASLYAEVIPSTFYQC
ncbi:prepilin-type N-terminal cleavage/methylation domain-containing protein [Aphanizomenon sp. PH219]|nr:prepilin-type N-terminal cleavage/methylation domain-containing protein [Aphanizomenon sp. 202]MDK2460990.1 prepilin-type N-terminal cleavage/methylation domain-containing protein [Aphanizomenon sp. PH219]